MQNSYIKQIKTLNSRVKVDGSFISIFVPLRSTEIPIEKIFLSLVKGANGLLVKSNHPPCTIAIPNWSHFSKQGALSLAIYHHDGVTTFIPMPIKMEPRFIVADSFHIKPLIAASNESIHSLLVHFHEQGVTLFKVGLTHDYTIDSYLPPLAAVEKNWPDQLDQTDLAEFINFLLHEIKIAINDETFSVGFCGTSQTSFDNMKYWTKIDLPKIKMNDSFNTISPENAISSLRMSLKEKVNNSYAAKVKKFKDNEDIELEELGGLILSGDINHLCVSLDDLHFGEIDEKSGHTVVSRAQQNIKDDDILDDLVEMALKKGIKVSVVPRKYLPPGRSYLVSSVN